MVVVTGISTAVPGVTGPAGLTQARTEPVVDPTRRLKGSGMRYKDRATKLALCAARDALHHGGLLLDGTLTVPGDTVGVVVSSNFGNVDTVCDSLDTITAHTYLGASPMLLPNTASNVIASWVAITYRLRGANLTLCNGPTSGLDAVHWARLLIAAGRVDRVLVIGVEPDNAPVRHLVGDTRLFDGAGALLLESEAAAQARGAPVLATVGGFARRATHPDAAATVQHRDRRPIGVRYLPEGLTGVPGIDLSTGLGRCSGALGVLQCVAGVDWLGRGADSLVLAGAGIGTAGAEDAAAVLLLGPPGGSG